MDIFTSMFFAGLMLGLLLSGIGTAILISGIKTRIESASFALPKNVRINLPSKSALLTRVPIGIGIVKGRIMLWGNPTMSKIIGYTPGEYQGLDTHLLYETEDEYRRVGKELNSALELTGLGEVETTIKRKDGTGVPCILHLTTLLSSHKDVDEGLRLVAITDISLTKGMQEVLRETTKKYHEIFQNLPVGIFRATINNHLIEANATLAAMFGFKDPKEMIDNVKVIRTDLFALPGDYDELLKKLENTETMVRTEMSMHTREGILFPCVLQARGVRNSSGSISYIEGIIEDVSEQKQAEAKLQQYQYQLENMIAERTRELDYSLDELSSAKAQLIESERLASLGSLVGGITHEINTPVGVAFTASTHLSGKIKNIQKNFRNSSLTRKDLENFLDTAEEAAAIIERNLESAREFITDIKQVAVDQSSEKLRRFNLAEYLQIIVTSLKPVLKRSRVEVKIECNPEIILDSYPGALSQVLTNLIMNSLIHGFSGRQKGCITIHGELIGDSKIVLSVADDGAGIAPDIRERIFDPYFTTKADSGGSGIGLHISASTVRDILGGNISVESELEKGAVFTIWFPSGTATAGT